MAVELLACHLHQTLRGWGITVNDTAHIVSLYADDAMIYLRQPDISVLILLNVMQEYWEFSGLRVNILRSALFPLVQLAGRPPEELLPTDLPWKVKTVRYFCEVFQSEDCEMILRRVSL
ncbi:hypothetical protein NDU88_009667 [Pleurodeles waltl]|uniref:Reverse transcriptase n=1 Tax=Pleurodeles waltl TaxID=8319 RepID=A0AAV7Q018_PLEWA|nr:hypothetical protein NDU88_009667 [Pleurodeles waltl]